MTIQKKARRGALITNIAMTVCVAFLLIMPWILGGVYGEPAKTLGVSPNPSLAAKP